MLLARRNEGLEVLLRGYVDELEAGKQVGKKTAKGKGRR
jgi:hypothetical protein